MNLLLQSDQSPRKKKLFKSFRKKFVIFEAWKLDRIGSRSYDYSEVLSLKQSHRDGVFEKLLKNASFLCKTQVNAIINLLTNNMLNGILSIKNDAF